MLSSGQTGTVSELQAALNAIKAAYTVAQPLTVESFDLLISLDKVHWVKAQIKTLFYRPERQSWVCYAKKSRGRRYSQSEVDVFLAVDGTNVYLIPHTGKSEMWSKNPDKKWTKLL